MQTKANGYKIKEGKQKRIVITMSERMFKAIKIGANKNKRSFSKHVNHLLYNYVELNNLLKEIKSS